MVYAKPYLYKIQETHAIFKPIGLLIPHFEHNMETIKNFIFILAENRRSFKSELLLLNKIRSIFGFERLNL